MSPAALRNNQTVVVLAQADLTVRTLQDLRREIASMGSPERPLAFRGYYVPEGDRDDAPLALITGLDRLYNEIGDGTLGDRPSLEAAIVREFLRRAHHYLPDVPQSGSWFEWLALMQHHGAPTRLLDWTYSSTIAVHFALTHASRQPDADLAVWAISTKWCAEASAALCGAAGKELVQLRAHTLRHDNEAATAAELLANELPACLWPINPFRLNERLTLQRGLFLAPGDVTRSFAENLAALPGRDRSNLRVFKIPRSASAGLIQELHDANVTEATLFPGLDGFSRSLWRSARSLDRTGLRDFRDL